MKAKVVQSEPTYMMEGLSKAQAMIILASLREYSTFSPTRSVSAEMYKKLQEEWAFQPWSPR